MEKQVKETLDRLHFATQSGDAEGILESIRELDAFRIEHRSSLHPQLLHFLEKRSYEKAHVFLGGETGEIPRGSCGR